MSFADTLGQHLNFYVPCTARFHLLALLDQTDIHCWTKGPALNIWIPCSARDHLLVIMCQPDIYYCRKGP